MKRPLPPSPACAARVLCALVVVAAACEPRAADVLPVDPPTARPSDGLLGDTGLQRLVDAGLRRDAAALLEALQDARPQVRARAAFALASFADSSAVGPLSLALDDQALAVRRDAAFALGRIGATTALPTLRRALERESSMEVRVRLLEAIGRMPSPEAADALLAVEPSAGEAAWRTAALATLGGVAGVQHTGLRDHLIDALGSEDAAVRLEASRYFGQTAGLGAWAGRKVLLRLALDGYAMDDPAAVGVLTGLGRSTDFLDGPRLRRFAQEATQWQVRAAATAALDPNSASAPVLLEALDDPHHHVALAAAAALSREAVDEAVAEAVERWLTEKPAEWQVAEPLLVLLGRMGRTDPVYAWVDATPDDHEGRWGAALRVLAFVAGEEVFPRLSRALGLESAGVRARARASLDARWTRDRGDERARDAYRSVFQRAAGSARDEVAAWARLRLDDPVFSGDREVEDGPPEPGRTDVDGRAPASPEAPRVDWDFLASLGPAPTLELTTERGAIMVRLLPEEAPLTVQGLARLAAEGGYDGVPFHRVEPAFLVQGGDVVAGDGTGDAGLRLRTELTSLPLGRGVLGIANAGRDTESTEFFLLHSRQIHLDGAHTAVGWVERGMGVVDALRLGDRIVSARVVPGG